MRSWAWLAVGGLLCGCAGDPVEGQGSAGSSGESSTSADDSATVSASMTVSDTITVGSQSDSGSTDSGLTITSAESTSDPSGDPTSATLDETDTSASDTQGESTTATSDATETTTTSETTGMMACEETDEGVGVDNGTEATAVALAAIACQTSMMVAGVADGATSPDWFAYHGSYDEIACGGLPEDYAEPRVQVDVAMPVCAFATCAGVEVTCAVGSAQLSPGGLSGCCGDSDAHLLVNCDTPDEEADVWVSVDTSAAVCQAYTLTLSY